MIRARDVAPSPGPAARSRLLAGAFALACALGAVTTARADEPPGPRPTRPAATDAPKSTASCMVRVIHAQPEGTVFDKELEPLRPQLTKPPLSAWKSFHLLSHTQLAVHGDKPSTFALPDGHEGQLDFRGTAEANGKQRLRLHLQILDGSAKLLSTTFLLNDGGTVLQAGIKYQAGMLVLGITCGLTP